MWELIIAPIINFEDVNKKKLNQTMFIRSVASTNSLPVSEAIKMQNIGKMQEYFLLSTLKLLLIISLAISGKTSHAIREASISSYIRSSPHSSARAIMRGGLYAFAGGVIPRGDIIFYDDENEKRIPNSELRLNIDPITGRPVVSWKDESYNILIQKSLECPLAQYVQRDTVIAFTIAVVADDPTYLESQGLTQIARGTYIAKDLIKQVNLLEIIDLSDDVSPINDATVKNIILTSMNKMAKESANLTDLVAPLGATGDGTYVNADFNVMYKGYMTKRNSRSFVDIAGLPLRYYWELSTDKKTPIFTDVETFDFPKSNSQNLLAQITFFQNAAIFRRFKQSQPQQFENFTKAVCSK